MCLRKTGCVPVFLPLSAASQATGRQGYDQFQLCVIFLCVCASAGPLYWGRCMRVRAVGICVRARDATDQRAGVPHRGCLSFATLQLYPRAPSMETSLPLQNVPGKKKKPRRQQCVFRIHLPGGIFPPPPPLNPS